jgi:hypothetical protein
MSLIRRHSTTFGLVVYHRRSRRSHRVNPCANACSFCRLQYQRCCSLIILWKTSIIRYALQPQQRGSGSYQESGFEPLPAMRLGARRSRASFVRRHDRRPSGSYCATSPRISICHGGIAFSCNLSRLLPLSTGRSTEVSCFDEDLL